MPRRLPARLVVAGFLLSVLAACGSPAATPSPSVTATPLPVTPVPTPAALDAFPSGFPTTFSDERPSDLPRLSAVDGGLRGHLDGTLVADGLTAAYTATWIESRVPAATIKCGGTTYKGVFTVSDPTVTSELTMPGWGSGTLLATRRVVVYVSSLDGSSPPACEEQRGGTFSLTFDTGPVPGILTGTWTESADGVVTLALGPATSP
jgi:hypothetical protein